MIKAIKDKVVSILMVRDKTAGGIIIPDSAQEPQAFCKVISIGDEVGTIVVGDIVVAHIHGGMDVIIEKEIIKVLKEDEIYGVLTDQSTLESLKEIELKIGKKQEKSNLIKL